MGAKKKAAKDRVVRKTLCLYDIHLRKLKKLEKRLKCSSESEVLRIAIDQLDNATK